jgi:hypothetical protein
MLRIPYALNILILTPVLLTLLGNSISPTAVIFDGKVAESEGLRLLVGALWSAILLCSVLGLIWPDRFVAVLVLQVIYKGLYLGLFLLPLLLRGGSSAIPWGVTNSFIAIVVVWPFFIWSAWR